MIRSLRRRHAGLVLGVAVIVPSVVLLALAARPSPPIMASLASPPATGSWTIVDSDGGLRALIEASGGREWLHLARDTTLVAPDVLVYWSPEPASGDEPFPPGAVLLGALGDPGTHTFNLPAREVSGVMLLYSLAHRSSVASLPLDRIRRFDRER